MVICKFHYSFLYSGKIHACKVLLCGCMLNRRVKGMLITCLTDHIRSRKVTSYEVHMLIWCLQSQSRSTSLLGNSGQRASPVYNLTMSLNIIWTQKSEKTKWYFAYIYEQNVVKYPLCGFWHAPCKLVPLYDPVAQVLEDYENSIIKIFNLSSPSIYFTLHSTFTLL